MGSASKDEARFTGGAVASNGSRGRQRGAAAAGEAARSDVVDAMLDVRGEVAGEARSLLGVDGEPRALTKLAETPLGRYPLHALGLLGLSAELHLYGFALLGPELSREVGMGGSSLVLIRSVVASLFALRLARNFQTRQDRGYVSVFTAAAWSLLTVGVALSSGSIIVPLILMSLAAGAVHAVHPSLLVDSYPPGARVRALTHYRAWVAAGVLAAAVVGAGVIALGFTWRVAFLVMGVLSLFAVAAGGRLRDPGFGTFDIDPVKRLVAAALGARVNEDDLDDGEPSDGNSGDGGGSPLQRLRRLGSARRILTAQPVPHRGYSAFPDVRFEGATVQCEGWIQHASAAARRLRFFEIAQRLIAIPTLRSVFAGWAMLGALLAPLFGFVSFYLEDRWGLGFFPRAAVWAGTAAASVLALALFAAEGERRYERDPAELLRLGARILAVGVVAVAMAVFAPVLPATVVLLVVGLALVGVVHPVLSMATLAVVQPRMRPHATALAAVFMAVVGAVGGALVLGGLDRRFGISVAVASLALPGLLVSLMLRNAGRTIRIDIEALIDEVVNAEELDVLARRGRHVPLLSSRNIDFSYGEVQVLFDVDFTVDEGEMVALLGTNGSGKSTLLKVISGIGLPDRGSVLYQGTDITYLDAARRVGLGIAQVPGGRAVFGPMTVVENLRTMGYSLGRERRRIDAAIDDCFATFPRLAERRNQPAAALSGGEQQMLGLSSALMLKPKLLLIDELSLGLAPVVVSELLETVRRINAEGTAVVLVEQSVNIALSVVEHAYFMEKGEMRFDGRAADLLQRPDLLRSVFLGAVARGDAASTPDLNGARQ